MKGFSGLLVGLLVTGLFMMALLIGGAQMATNISGSQSINTQPQIAKLTANLTTQLDSAYGTANATEEAVSKSKTTITQGTVFLDAMAGVWTTMKVVPIAVYNAVSLFLNTTLLSGNPMYLIIGGVISAILIFMFVLYAWKVIRTGDPE